MAWTASLDVSVGDATKETDYDNLVANAEYLQTLADVAHDFDVSTGTGEHNAPIGIGIASASADGTGVHAHAGTAGTVTASSLGDQFVAENNGNAGISILTPNTAIGGIYFGDPVNNIAGQFYYDHSNTWFQMRAEDAIWRFDSDGSFLASSLSTESMKIVDAGSVSATEQDWIQVEVGGNTGYIRVFATK